MLLYHGYIRPKFARMATAAGKQLFKYTKVNSVQKVHSATDPSIFGECNGLPSIQISL